MTTNESDSQGNANPPTTDAALLARLGPLIKSLCIGSLAALAVGLAGCGRSVEPADAIYINANVITMNDAQPRAEALAVKDSKILAVGSRADLESTLMGKSTHMIDLAGKTLLPGFLDAHSHYINALSLAGQASLYPPPAGPGKDVPSILAELRKFAEERNIPKGELIIAYGYDDTVMPDGRLLNRDDLDAAFPDNPVRVDHVSMHGTVLNSLALERFGFDANTPTPAGGIIVRKPGTNEPWGLIMETAFLQIFANTPPMTPEQEVDGTRAAQQMYAAAGITTAHEGATHLDQIEIIKRAAAAGGNTIDLVTYPFMTDVDKILPAFPVSDWEKYESRVKIQGIKITIDGSPQGRTAAFTTPYLAGGPSGQEGWKGQLFASQEVINQVLKKAYDLGVPVTFHVNGDAAIDAMLEAHEFAAADDLTRYRNVTAIHSQFLRKDQIEKYVRYKIRPSFFTLHTFYFADAHIANRSMEQAMYISPMRDAIDAGLHPTNHTDAPVVPLDQMFMLWTAVNRISRSGMEIGPDQRVTPLEGLKAMTIWVAEQYGEQDTKGSLEPGKLADMVVLSDDPLQVDPMKIPDIKVLETIKEGTTVYKYASP